MPSRTAPRRLARLAHAAGRLRRRAVHQRRGRRAQRSTSRGFPAPRAVITAMLDAANVGPRTPSTIWAAARARSSSPPRSGAPAASASTSIPSASSTRGQRRASRRDRPHDVRRAGPVQDRHEHGDRGDALPVPDVNERLRPKLLELTPGHPVVSHDFAWATGSPRRPSRCRRPGPRRLPVAGAAAMTPTPATATSRATRSCAG